MVRLSAGQGLQGAGKVALLGLDVAHSVQRCRKVTLPAGIAGIGVRQRFFDGKAGAIGFQRARQVPLCHLRIADLV